MTPASAGRGGAPRRRLDGVRAQRAGAAAAHGTPQRRAASVFVALR